MVEPDHGRDPLAPGVTAGASAPDALRGYVRFAALGDSATYGFGDPTSEGCRGWARILTDAVAQDHEVSLCNLARPGATVADVRHEQLREALHHRPHLASLIVGLNDTMRSAWEPARLRADLLHCAGQLAEREVLLLTARFHDHSRVFRLPRFLARPLRERIDVLNGIYDEIHDTYGGLQVDLGVQPGVYDRKFWSIDRLHPSPLGHRALAATYATLLHARGLSFEPPALHLDSEAVGRLGDLRWLVAEVAPWLARRLRDLGPSAARTLVHQTRALLT
jgi:lysophospholipase L1-like esterase